VLLLEDWAACGIGSCPLHSQQHWRVVLPDQKAMAAYQAFDENENLKDESQQAYHATRQQTRNRDRQIEYLT